jgi:hypothetical protein
MERVMKTFEAADARIGRQRHYVKEMRANRRRLSVIFFGLERCRRSRRILVAPMSIALEY